MKKRTTAGSGICRVSLKRLHAILEQGEVSIYPVEATECNLGIACEKNKGSSLRKKKREEKRGRNLV